MKPNDENTVDGFNFESNNVNNVVSTTLTAEGSTLKLYYTRVIKAVKIYNGNTLLVSGMYRYEQEVVLEDLLGDNGIINGYTFVEFQEETTTTVITKVTVGLVDINVRAIYSENSYTIIVDKNDGGDEETNRGSEFGV